MSVLTRKSINPNIIFHDYNLGNRNFDTYNYFDMCKMVNGYKNLFQEHGAKTGETIILNTVSYYHVMCAFIAASELGLVLTIPTLMYHLNNEDKYEDARIKALLPLNYFYEKDTDYKNRAEGELKAAVDFFARVCGKTIFGEPHDFSVNRKMYCEDDMIHNRCTSSGTTGKPKTIEHTQNFIVEVSKRNAKSLGKNFIMNRTFNHGASLATFYLPALVSEKTENVYFYSYDCSTKPDAHIGDYTDSVQFLYPDQVEFFYEKHGKCPNITAYLLCAIRPEWKKYIEEGVFKDIVSMYGTTEVLGPVLKQSLSDPDWSPRRYVKFDDEFPCTLDGEGGTLRTFIPFYNRVHDTGDKFTANDDGSYTFHGRRDTVRVNDLIIPVSSYDNILKENGLEPLTEASLTYDSFQNRIYLSFWKDVKDLESLVKKISEKLNEKSFGRHFISKYNTLKVLDYLSGNKLDQELIRLHYRDENENWKGLTKGDI